MSGLLAAKGQSRRYRLGSVQIRGRIYWNRLIHGSIAQWLYCSHRCERFWVRVSVGQCAFSSPVTKASKGNRRDIICYSGQMELSPTKILIVTHTFKTTYESRDTGVTSRIMVGAVRYIALQQGDENRTGKNWMFPLQLYSIWMTRAPGLHVKVLLISCLTVTGSWLLKKIIIVCTLIFTVILP